MAAATAAAVPCRTGIQESRHHLRGTVGRGNADVRNALAATNYLGEADGRVSANADDHVAARDALEGVVHDVSRHIDDSGIENARVQIGNESLDTAGEGDARRARNDEGRREL